MHIIIMLPQAIIIGMPDCIMVIMRLQHSMNMAWSMPAAGFISHIMPLAVMVQVISHIIIIGIIPIIWGIMPIMPFIGIWPICGIIMPWGIIPIWGIIIGIMPICGIMFMGIMFIGICMAGFIAAAPNGGEAGRISLDRSLCPRASRRNGVQSLEHAFLRPFVRGSIRMDERNHHVGNRGVILEAAATGDTAGSTFDAMSFPKAVALRDVIAHQLNSEEILTLPSQSRMFA